MVHCVDNIWDGFYGQMTQPAVSKHWGKIGLQSHQVQPTMLRTIIQQLCSLCLKLLNTDNFIFDCWHSKPYVLLHPHLITGM